MNRGEFLYIQGTEFMGFLRTRGLELNKDNEVIIDPDVEYYPTRFRFFRDISFLYPGNYEKVLFESYKESIKKELPVILYKIYVEHKKEIYSYIDDFSYIKLIGIGLIDKNINPHKRIFSRRF